MTVTVRGTRLRGRSRLTAIGAGGMPPALEPPSSGERCRRPVLQSAVRAVLAAVHPLVRSSFEPLFRTGSAVRTARPTTRTAFAGLKILDRALDSAAARCFLFGRDDPTNPFVPCQRRQILPSRLRLRFRAERQAQVRRSFVHRTGLACFALIHRFIVTVPRTELSEQPGLTASDSEAVLRVDWRAALVGARGRP